MAPKRSDQNSLAVVVIDVSPVVWGERELRRAASDKSRLAAGKRSLGPAILEEVLSSVQAFANAFLAMEKDAALLMVAVAGKEVAVVYPRKDALQEYFDNAESKLDGRQIHDDLYLGVAELVSLSAKRQANDTDAPLSASLAAMASAFSTSLCLINRFLVRSNAGVSALQRGGVWHRTNADDQGVLTAIGGSGKKKSSKTARAWSPRILLVQASDDRPNDYNAIMNCAFAAVKHQIVVDGCFIPCSGAKTSAFLEQTCDLTGGVFLAPSGASQCNKALTEVLFSVFLPNRLSRGGLNLPAINKVDFRARAFDTGESVDMAYVCNQCLSIFEKLPEVQCPTCDAEIRSRKRQQA